MCLTPRNTMPLFDRWIRGYTVPTEGLALFRILVCLHLFLLGFPSFGDAGGIPPAFFNPPRYSIAAFFESAPSVLFLNALSVLALVLGVALLFGYRTRLVSILLPLVVITGMTFGVSFGKINHGPTLFLALPLALAFSPWGEAFSIDAVRRGRKHVRGTTYLGWENAWPVALMAVVIGFAYFSAGFPKSLVWVDFDLTTHGARSWLIGGFQESERQQWLAPWFFYNQNAVFWEMLDLTAVAFEVGFFFAVLHARVFRLFCAIAILFHMANIFMLNIDFTRLAIIYTLFLPWDYLLASRWGERLRAAATVFRSWRAFLVTLVVLVGLLLARPIEGIALLLDLAGLVFSEPQMEVFVVVVNVLFGVLVAVLILRSIVADVLAKRSAQRDAPAAGIAPAS